MRKSFLTKAFVAVGVMTSALALSSMAVFAETETDTTTGVTKNTVDGVTTWDFVTTTVSSNTNVTSEILGIKVEYTTDNSDIKVSKSKYLSVQGANNPVFAVPVNYSAGSIILTDNSGSKEGSSARYLAMVSKNVSGETITYTDIDKQLLNKSGATYYYSASSITTINNNSYVLFRATGGEAKIKTIVENNVTLPDYKLEVSDIQSSPTSDYYDGNNNFFIDKGVALKNSNKEIQVITNAGIRFKMASNGKIVFKGLRGSNSDNTRTIYVAKSDGTALYQEALDNTAKDLTIDNVAAGLYYVYGLDGGVNFTEIDIYGTLAKPDSVESTTSSSVSIPAVIKKGDNTYYAIILIDPTVKGAEISDDSVNLDVIIKKDGVQIDTVDEAYSTVVVDGKKYTAAIMGGKDGQYVYGFNVDTTGITTDDMVAYIQEHVTVTQTVA